MQPQLRKCCIARLNRGIDTSTEVPISHSHTFPVLNIGGNLFLMKGTVNGTPFI